MNLTKWFNGKYLLQNLKKSKGILTLLVLIIPVITTLIIISMNASVYDVVVDSFTLSFANIIGMYVIPFIISVVIGGYIYKRNSVDFINSMPMNRKTIFFTNFIAGILVILAIQVLTLITNLVCASIFPEIFIPTGMIIDSFIVMLISYIFVFSASMLALTVSGNVLTQIVVTALIIFLIPFSHMTFTIFQETGLEISFTGGKTELIEISNLDYYTMPFKMVAGVFENVFLYNEVSMAKMIVLTVFYALVGIWLFEKRKMENTGTSFITLKSHYIVKGLTLVPMIFVLGKANVSNVYMGIGLTLIAVYYVVYDFIVSKKVKLKNTIIGFVATVVILFGVYTVGEKAFMDVDIQAISVNDIKGIGLTDLYNMHDNFALNRTLDAMIQDKNMIETIMQNTYSRDAYPETVAYDVDKSFELYKECETAVMKVKLQNGQEKYFYALINEDVYNDAITYLKSNTDYSDTFKFREITASINSRLLPTEDVDKIKEILEKRDYNLENGLYKINTQTMQVIIYDNHAMRTIDVDLGLTKDLFEIVTKNTNERTKNILDEYNNDYSRANVYCSVEKLKLNAEGTFDRDYIHFNSSAKLLNYISNHYQEEVNLNKEFVCISIYADRPTTFYINTNDEINQMIRETNIKWDSEHEDVEVTEFKQ